MKRIGFLLALVLAACAPPPAPAPHAKVGASDIFLQVQWVGSPAAVTGNNATITLYDSTVGYSQGGVQRIMFSGFYDQAVTVLYRTKNTGSSTWRTINGGGSGDTVVASTSFITDYFVLGPSSQLQVVTGSTGPTTSETSIGLVYERTLGM